MPFMKGPAPIRRTLKYLEAGKLILKDKIRIFLVNYNSFGDHHNGARDFVFWSLPQLQYKNPNTQVITIKDLTPSPFITCFLENEKEILIDIDFKSKDEVEKHLFKTICKSELDLKQIDEKENESNFGYGCPKPCMCVVPGQVPCPGIVPLPIEWRGKTKSQS